MSGILRRLAAALLAVLVVLGFSATVAVPAAATTNSNPGVCQPQESHLYPPNESTKTITVTAPEGKVITKYCVKAGSVNQGLGPEEKSFGAGVTSVEISHSSGKDISHYIVFYGDAPTREPLVETETESRDTCTGLGQQRSRSKTTTYKYGANGFVIDTVTDGDWSAWSAGTPLTTAQQESQGCAKQSSVVTETQTQDTCAGNGQERTRSKTTSYKYVNSAWVVDAITYGAWSQWSAGTPLTQVEGEERGCAKQPSTQIQSQTRSTCLGMEQQRTRTLTTSYTWSGTAWVGTTTEGEWGDWSTGAPLTTGQLESLGCAKRPLVETETQSQDTCNGLGQQRSRSKTMSYKYVGEAWVVDTVVYGDWSAWSTGTPLTQIEGEELGCDKQPAVATETQTRDTCAGMGQQRTRTLTTTYAWNGSGWVGTTTDGAWSDWSAGTPLTTEQQEDLGCNEVQPPNPPLPPLPPLPPVPPVPPMPPVDVEDPEGPEAPKPPLGPVVLPPQAGPKPAPTALPATGAGDITGVTTLGGVLLAAGLVLMRRRRVA